MPRCRHMDAIKCLHQQVKEMEAKRSHPSKRGVSMTLETFLSRILMRREMMRSGTISGLCHHQTGKGSRVMCA